MKATSKLGSLLAVLALTAAPLHAAVIIPTGATAGSTLTIGNRNIAYVIGGQGFNEGTQRHAAFAEGNSWTSNVILANQTLDIVFNLGDNYDLDAAHIWNWNHSITIGASIGQLEILVASTVGGPTISLGNFTLNPGTGLDNYAGDSLAINPSNVREVTFRLASNQGYSYGGGYLLGLSEVRFGGTVAVPEPSGVAALGLAGVLMLARRRR